MTPLTIINLALKITGITGVGQTALPEDINDTFTILNAMIAGWNRRRWMIYHLVDTKVTGNGSQFYTIGLGQQFNVARPDQIQSAYARQLQSTSSSPVDFPLAMINSHEEYGDLALKSLVSFPRFIFYDSSYPIGNVYVYPIPTSNYEIHLVLKETIAVLPDLVTDINLPPEYQEAIIWNLAARLRPLYQVAQDPTVHAVAMSSLAVIRGANAQIPKLRMPAGLSRQGGAYTTHGVGGIAEGTFTLDESVLG